MADGSGGDEDASLGGGVGGDGGGGEETSSVFFVSVDSEPPSTAPSFNLNNFPPFSTEPPSSTNISTMTPAAGELNGNAVLSVSISPTTSSSSTESLTPMQWN